MLDPHTSLKKAVVPQFLPRAGVDFMTTENRELIGDIHQSTEKRMGEQNSKKKNLTYFPSLKKKNPTITTFSANL